MQIRHILTTATALCLLAGPIFAQNLETDIREQTDRAAGVYHSYEYLPGPQTPAPKGFKPFYVSHYGRHGSRHQIGTSGRKAFEYMEAARNAGLLTDAGEALYADVKKVYDEHVGMDGELTIRGGEEHAGIARRLYRRAPAAFNDKHRTHVYCQASIIPRCLLSMAHFTENLKDEAPRLDFDFITGQKYIELLAHDYYDKDAWRNRQREIRDSVLHAHFSADRLMQTYFKQEPALQEVIPHPNDFARYLFAYASICQDLVYELDGLDLFPYFTDEEILGLATYFNNRTYSSFGNSIEFGDHITWAAKWLLEDIVQRADAALAADSDRAADLRFGHDSGILPLVGLMGLEGAGDRYPSGQAHLYYPVWKNIPMASNLQLLFYRNKKGEVLVKVLYNERETAVPAVSAVQGPYYRWEDLRAWWVSRSQDKTFGK